MALHTKLWQFVFQCILLPYLLAMASDGYAQQKAAQFDSIFSKLYEENKFTGNVLIAEGGKPIFQKSYGKAFREKGLDLNSETVFELASVSKQFTAMGVMLLRKQGKISYDDSLRKFFPELPYHKINVRHLLQHTSGLPDYLSLAEEHWDSTKILTNSEMIAMLTRIKPPLLFAPGSKWEYSNTGYALLASIIEKASGKSFSAYLSESIFRPLGMTRTLVYRKRFEKRLIDNYAYGYVKDKSGNYIMADSLPGTAKLVYSMDGVYGDGVVNSTTGDLLKWDQALYTEKLVDKRMLDEAFTEANLSNGKTFNYGFGWLLVNSETFGRYYFHAGGWPGYMTWLERHPRDNKTIILLANAGEANTSIKALRNILFGVENKLPTEIQLDENALLQYAGHYAFDNGDTLTVRLDNGMLFASSGGGREHQIHAEAVDLFFRKDRDDLRFKMIRNSEGVVTAIEILREGPAIEVKKISAGK